MQCVQKRLLSTAFLAGLIIMSGCADDSKKLSASQQQDAILKDPSAYKPAFGQDISGGNITTLDQNGLNRDLDHALNP